jgi:hypothetical protein
MYCEVISESNPRATKYFDCNACEFITMGGRPDFFDCAQDYRDYIKAKENNFKVIPGEKYIRQSMICDGDFHCAKSIPAIHKICIKYDLYAL